LHGEARAGLRSLEPETRIRRRFRIAAFAVLLLAALTARTHESPLKSGAIIRNARAGALRRARPVWTHSHNDYLQRHPLADAMANGFRSVEADIWLDGNDLLVGHVPLAFVGTLQTLYLDPLQRIVDRQGSVYGDGVPLYLWIDIKSKEAGLRPVLREQLSHYPMLRGASPMVIAILTGDEPSKAAYIQDPAQPFACRDSNEVNRSDPPGDASWPWYALRWHDYFDWDGRGVMPRRERILLWALVAQIHAGGRMLRLWETPDTEALWSELLDADVDMLGTDDLPRLRRFLAPPEALAKVERR